LFGGLDGGLPGLLETGLSEFLDFRSLLAVLAAFVVFLPGALGDVIHRSTAGDELGQSANPLFHHRCGGNGRLG
jgi:hypothetical protein